jgi:hypothetical protein
MYAMRIRLKIVRFSRLKSAVVSTVLGGQRPMAAEQNIDSMWMYTDVQGIGAGFPPALDAGVHRVHDHLGADDGAYRRPVGMIERDATIHVPVTAKANGFLGGAGAVLARAARRALMSQHRRWWHRPMRAI